MTLYVDLLKRSTGIHFVIHCMLKRVTNQNRLTSCVSALHAHTSQQSLLASTSLTCQSLTVRRSHRYWNVYTAVSFSEGQIPHINLDV